MLPKIAETHAKVCGSSFAHFTLASCGHGIVGSLGRRVKFCVGKDRCSS